MSGCLHAMLIFTTFRSILVSTKVVHWASPQYGKQAFHLIGSYSGRSSCQLARDKPSLGNFTRLG